MYDQLHLYKWPIGLSVKEAKQLWFIGISSKGMSCNSPNNVWFFRLPYVGWKDQHKFVYILHETKSLS